MTKQDFWEKWMDHSFSIGPQSKKEEKQLMKEFMKDLDDVIYTVAMEAIKQAEKKIAKGK